MYMNCYHTCMIHVQCIKQHVPSVLSMFHSSDPSPTSHPPLSHVAIHILAEEL